MVHHSYLVEFQFHISLSFNGLSFLLAWLILSCCHCLDIDDVEWYEGKGSPSDRETSHKLKNRSSDHDDGEDDDGGDDASGGHELDHEFENLPSFNSWEKRHEQKFAAQKTEMSTLGLKTSTTTATASTELQNEPTTDSDRADDVKTVELNEN